MQIKAISASFTYSEKLSVNAIALSKFLYNMVKIFILRGDSIVVPALLHIDNLNKSS